MKQAKYGRYKGRAIQFSKSVGYYFVKISGKFTLLHRLVAEELTGIKLKPENIVHHADKNRFNNSPSNLVVLENKSEHAEMHRRMRIQERCGDWRTQKICDSCGELKRNEEFHKHKNCSNGRSGICVSCSAERAKKLRQTEKYRIKFELDKNRRNARLRLRYKTDPAYREKILALAAKQRAAKLIGWGG